MVEKDSFVYFKYDWLHSKSLLLYMFNNSIFSTQQKLTALDMEY